MAYLGPVPSERSTDESVKRGSITKAGNGRVRCVLVEAAWAYRHPPRVGYENLADTRVRPKVNWNTSQFDGGLPITLRAARELSRVLRYVPGTVREVPQYSIYI